MRRGKHESQGRGDQAVKRERKGGKEYSAIAEASGSYRAGRAGGGEEGEEAVRRGW